MAQVTLYAKNATMNWDDANAWNTAADGSGTDYTNPQNGGGNTYICDLNGAAKTISINVAVSVDQIRQGVTTGGGKIAIPNGTAATITVASANGFYGDVFSSVTWGTGTCSLTINGSVTYAGTSTSGMIPYTTSQTVTVNGRVTNSSSGYALGGTGSGALTISNAGGTAVTASGSGRVVNHTSTGSLQVSGDILSSGAGYGVRILGNCTWSVTGNITTSGLSSSCGVGSASASAAGTITGTISGGGISVECNNGSVSVVGNMSSSGSGVSVTLAGGTLTWIGSRTLSAAADCRISLSGGTLALANGTGALSLANSGTIAIYKTGGTLTTTSGANTASIANQSATAYASIIGGSDANKAIITGASIPSAADTRYGVARGWADGGTGATAGCGVASGNGLLEIPNSSSPTGTQDATSDACVVSAKKYGSPQRTGSAAGGIAGIIQGNMTGGMNG
jgi:hypothetical protein